MLLLNFHLLVGLGAAENLVDKVHQPFDAFSVQVVGWLVQQEQIRLHN